MAVRIYVHGEGPGSGLIHGLLSNLIGQIIGLGCDTASPGLVLNLPVSRISRHQEKVAALHFASRSCAVALETLVEGKYTELASFASAFHNRFPREATVGRPPFLCGPGRGIDPRAVCHLQFFT